MLRRPRSSTLFPYTTLFRSAPFVSSSSRTALGSSGRCAHGSPPRPRPARNGISGWCARTCSTRSEEHTSELQSQSNLVCRLLLEKKNHRHLIGAGDQVENLE